MLFNGSLVTTCFLLTIINIEINKKYFIHVYKLYNSIFFNFNPFYSRILNWIVVINRQWIAWNLCSCRMATLGCIEHDTWQWSSVYWLDYCQGRKLLTAITLRLRQHVFKVNLFVFMFINWQDNLVKQPASIRSMSLHCI